MRRVVFVPAVEVERGGSRSVGYAATKSGVIGMSRAAAVPTVLAAALALSLPAAAEHRHSMDVTVEEGDARGCAGVQYRPWETGRMP